MKQCEIRRILLRMGLGLNGVDLSHCNKSVAADSA